MPRGKQFDVDAALTRAMEAFWSKGYEAVSLQDLLDRMSINRGSLYDTFGNKRRLFVEALRHYEATYQRPKLAAAARGRTPRNAIRALFEELAREAVTDPGRSGCFMVNTALELAAHDEEVGRIVADGFREIGTFLRTTIERGQETGEIPDRIDPAEVSHALLGLMIGMRVLARSLPDRAVLDAIASRAVAMLG